MKMKKIKNVEVEEVYVVFGSDPDIVNKFKVFTITYEKRKRGDKDGSEE